MIKLIAWSSDDHMTAVDSNYMLLIQIIEVMTKKNNKKRKFFEISFTM